MQHPSSQPIPSGQTDFTFSREPTPYDPAPLHEHPDIRAMIERCRVAPPRAAATRRDLEVA